jgi:hypothetical protein
MRDPEFLNYSRLTKIGGTVPTQLESSEAEEDVDLSGRHSAVLLLRACCSS